MSSLNLKTKVSIEKLLKLERCGRYNEAVQELSEIWEDKSVFPNVENFSKREAAEILLRCGSLIGFLGHNEQIPDSQEKSKNLLTEALERYLNIYDVEKIAECENYLALAYWRSGGYEEADTWIDGALSKNLPNSSFVRLYSIIIKCGNHLPNNKYKEIIELLTPNKELFLRYGDNCLIGDFYNFYGLALKNLNKTSKALECFELSKNYHIKSQHQIYLGTVENNIAQTCKLLKKFTKAHQAIDNSAEIFKSINADARYGFALDTKALIYVDERKFDEALETVDTAINILEKGDNKGFLVETLSTKINVLINLNQLTEAALCLSEAINIAKVHINEAKANKLAEDFVKVINKTKSPVITKIYTEKEFANQGIELILPPELSHHQEIQGVWIKNEHLENVGLRKDSMAIVAESEIKRGDLVAIIEIETDDVVCGFYDADFGVVCLERMSGEPQLYNEDEIQVLGKIIGVADSNKDDDGRMHVEPINAFKQ